MLSDEIAGFRKELRSFFKSEIPPEIRAKVSAGQPLRKEDFVRSQRILNSHGYAVPHWPQEWGGRGWSALKLCVFIDELQRAAVPLPLQFNCNMVGPVIATFGNAEQKARFLQAAANLDHWWCQGFSEPEAGSDLASLRTTATRTAEGYRVSGQKAWTTYAQYADWIFCLVRTSNEGKKQEGISFVLIDMTTPGITVRPVITVDGRHEVNEVFFDDVLVPFENLVGEENKGWTYAKFLLANERAGIARLGLSKERIDRVRRLAQSTPFGDGVLWDFEPFRARVVDVELSLKALELTQMRIVSEGAQASRPSPLSSILKLEGSRLQQAATELLMEVGGSAGLRSLSDVSDPYSDLHESSGATLALATYMNFRKVSIYGGSNEVQRNIIAKTVLGI